MKHDLNGGEIKIINDKVDGYYSVTKTVYQFHGSPTCYEEYTLNKVKKRDKGDLDQETCERTQHIRKSGLEVVEMWECVFKRQELQIPVLSVKVKKGPAHVSLFHIRYEQRS